MAADETDILFEHMQSFWLEKTDHLSLLSKRIEEFILWKRKKKVEYFVLSEIITCRSKTFVTNPIGLFLLANIVKTLESRTYSLTKYLR